MRALTWLPVFVAGVLMVAAGSYAADGTQAVTFILDCSASMSAKMPVGDGQVVQTASNRGDSRLDIAKTAIKEALDKLSVDGDHRVGLILFGHRLAWEQGVAEPALMEQTQYLEQTLGFEVLKELLPGDDVEIARHLSAFEPRDLTMLEARFNVVQPWGEEPLYLAILKGVDTFEKPGRASERRIIVITDGANNQGMSKHKTTKDQVLEAVDRRPVPVHIFRVGNDDIGRQAESDLIQIAKRSGGEYQTTATAAELTAQIQSAMAVRATRKEQVARVATPAAATTTTTTDIAPSTVSSIATTVTNEPKEEPKLTKLQGSVSYYGIPAKRAKIVLEGESSQVVLRTDAQGNFSIDDVEPGMYTISTEAIVKNTFRNAARKLKVDNTGRTKTIDLILD